MAVALLWLVESGGSTHFVSLWRGSFFAMEDYGDLVATIMVQNNQLLGSKMINPTKTEYSIYIYEI